MVFFSVFVSGVSEVSQVEIHVLLRIALVNDWKGNFFQLNWINLIITPGSPEHSGCLPAHLLCWPIGSIFSVHFYK